MTPLENLLINHKNSRENAETYMGQGGNFHEMPSCIHTTIIIQTNIANILNEYGFLCTTWDIQIDSIPGTIFILILK